MVLLVTFVAGFVYKSEVSKPDLHRLYMETMEITDQPPVVFIHGVLGSKLRDIKEVIIPRLPMILIRKH
jgi:hypothetical protein